MTFFRPAVVIWAAFAIASGWVILHTPVRTDLTAFLPAAATRTQELLLKQLREGAASRIVLIAIEGAKPETLAETSRELARSLGKSGLFSYVSNGEVESLDEARDVLFRNRYVLSPAVNKERFTEEALRTALNENLRLLASSAGSLIKETLPADPTREFITILSRIGYESGPASEHGVWFSRDGTRALLLAETLAPGSDLDRQQDAIERIQASFGEIGSGAKLLLSGSGVFAQDARQTIEREAYWLSLAAALFAVLILLSVYRSTIPALLTALPVATGMLAGIAAVALGFGFVHGITLGFGATLIGEAVDYPSYVFTHSSPAERLEATLARIWPTLRLAVLTTAFGACAMLFSSFTGLSQLGVLTVSGVLAAGMTTRFVLPEMTRAGFRTRLVPARAFEVAARLRRAAILPWVAVIAASAVLIAHRHAIWDDDIANLSPVSQAAKDLDEALRAELGAPDVRYLLVIEAESKEQASQRSEEKTPWLESLVETGVIAGYELAATLLPSAKTQETRRAALPEAEELASALTKAAQGLPFREGLFAPFVKDVARARAGGSIDETSYRGTALALKVDSLLLQDKDRWIALAPLKGIADREQLRKVASVEPDIQLLDLKTESNEMIASYRVESLRYIAAGMLSIAGVLAIGLGWRGAIRVLAPVAAAVVIDLGILVLLGQRLNLFHLVSLLLVVGIGVNYSLFFNRPIAGSEEQRRTLTSLLLVSMTTISAFGCLAFSSNPVLHAIGVTVAIGASLSLLNAAILARGNSR